MDRPISEKSVDAYRTIGEVAADLDLPPHVLRFWETRFPQVRPLKRAGGRRFYRPADVALLREIRAKLYDEGYTIKGVQRLLRERGGKDRASPVVGMAGGEKVPAISSVDVIKDNPSDDVPAVTAPGGSGIVDPPAAPIEPALRGGAPVSSMESPAGDTGRSAGIAALRETLLLVEACEHRLRAALASGA